MTKPGKPSVPRATPAKPRTTSQEAVLGYIERVDLRLDDFDRAIGALNRELARLREHLAPILKAIDDREALRKARDRAIARASAEVAT